MVLALCTLSAAHTHRARVLRAREPLQIIVLAFLGRQLDTVVVVLSVRHREHGVEHVAS